MLRLNDYAANAGGNLQRLVQQMIDRALQREGSKKRIDDLTNEVRYNKSSSDSNISAINNDIDGINTEIEDLRGSITNSGHTHSNYEALDVIRKTGTETEVDISKITTLESRVTTLENTQPTVDTDAIRNATTGLRVELSTNDENKQIGSIWIRTDL